MDTLLSMRIFSRVVETGSFSAAAVQMEYSKACVSRAVSMLENRLHTRLLNRTTRSLSLTESGQRYYARCKQVLVDLDDAEAEAVGAYSRPHGTLHVHCSPELGLRRVTQCLVEYQRQHPSVKVHVTFIPGTAHLIKDRVDVSIVPTASLPDSGNVSRIIGQIEHVLVAEPRYLRTCRIDTFDQVVAHALTPVPTRVSTSKHQARLNIVKLASTNHEGPIVIDDVDATRFAVLAGAGVAALPLHCVIDDIRQGSLVWLFPEQRLERTPVYVLYASRRHVDAKIRTFVDFVVAHMIDTLQAPRCRTVPGVAGLAPRPEHPACAG
ncbi:MULTISPECIES: LysR family transcriptional regulator [Burkholderia]|uniref:LysR family transcriptional regulator n=1 Tax=Burkholderia sola TaxID=2843302 RepID=A0ABV2C9B2_9BURK|nr:LysR family transcriptional regulator [Burkholderia sp. CpTa8-5]MBP0607748.1 LysR family transcriptional regulator [Burkholderia sp. CpTa8-5]RQZ85902.1 LysR family transcriptional regulator [Burkholderia cenocepacia]RRA05552.1 LysR family transcriptional regulator [Burkholderia cenocepacia]